jgi:hypothetical protein
MRLLLTLVLLSATAGVARADAIADLRQALTPLSGTSSVSAAVEVQIWSKGGFGDGTPEQGRTHFKVRGGPEGISFQFPPSELDRAEAEEKRNRINPEEKTPITSALREIDALDAQALLNFAPTLLGYLQRGKVISDKPAQHAGRPARLVTIEVDPPLPKELRKRIREAHYRVTLLLGSDGVPVSGQAALYGKARFLVLSFEHRQSRSWTFARAGDRLLVTSHADRSSGSGFGQKYERRVEVRVRVGG